ncbi:uncharacterized protein BKA55DRAFT_550947 [Fusarium redolens]|uniref:Mid2 domain-containing protein n=1 Tax=Fusarium redolens TaxID=48865 RepID=A0A9P9R8G4_FUSRE|nr:uncharacterized protein BKA55DRAFT_550947 [Fusarium redolens]KAH7270231.1 hypothetical protein BKA55DRAFT_550947 [Fusarium redolens]
MAQNLQSRHGKECRADKAYYECSDFDFDFKGCCSHDPCIRPRGCRDDDSTDRGSWPIRDMSDIESSASETTAIESTVDMRPAVGSGIFTASFPSDDSDTESTLVTRRRPSSHSSMDDDNENDASPRRHSHSKTMTDSGTTRTIPNSIRITVTKNTVIFTSKLPSSSTSVESITETAVDTTPTASFQSTPAQSPTETGASSLSTGDSDSGGPSIGLIVGGVVGGVAALALVVLVVIILRRRKDTDEQLDGADMPYNNFDEKEEKSYLSRMLSRSTNKGGTDPFAPFGGTSRRYAPSESSSEVTDSFPKQMLKLLCRPYRQSRRPPPPTQWHF